MAGQRRSRVRFEEREELLDFLLEVSSLTNGTLDLERLLPLLAPPPAWRAAGEEPAWSNRDRGST